VRESFALVVVAVAIAKPASANKIKKFKEENEK